MDLEQYPAKMILVPHKSLGLSAIHAQNDTSPVEKQWT